MSAAVRDVLILAAELMDDPQKRLWGACEAISTAERWQDMRASESFAAMFKPTGTGNFWFSRLAQDLLTGKAADKARAHRVYALLLCAEAHEEFL